MAFTWKDNGKIFVGEGIYHLTFNVACDNLKLGTIRGRSKEEIAAVVQPLLDAGEVCDASNPKYVAAVKEMAWVDLKRMMTRVMQKAEIGTVTYTAAKSKGEQRIAREVREAEDDK